jgi:spermidine synthase
VTRELDTTTAEIMRDVDVADGWMLLLNGVPSSYLDLADPTRLEFEYMRWIGYAVDLHHVDLHHPDGDDPLRVVHLGGGACALAKYVAATRPGARQIVVEYDAGLVTLVREVFGIRTGPGLKIRTGDARDVLAAAKDATADVIIRDAFAGPSTPAHLTTVEFVTDVVRVLRADGLYLANLTDGPPLRVVRSELATAQACFAHVALVAESPVLKGRRYGNLIVVASAEALPVDDLARLLARNPSPTRVLAGDELTRFVAGAGVLTDATWVDVAAPPSRPGTWGVSPV